MNFNNMLVVGNQGHIGSMLFRQLQKEADMNAFGFDKADFDITCDYETLKTRILHYYNLKANPGPFFVINVAGITTTKSVIAEPEKALAVNVGASNNIAQICRELGLYYILFSTKYVFGFDERRTYNYLDKPWPANAYGESKYIAEHGAQTIMNDKLIIVRTSDVFGGQGEKDFVSAKIAEGTKNGWIYGVTDQLTSFTYVEDLAKAVMSLIRQKAEGIYHVVNRGYATWFEFFQKVADFTGNIFEVKPITTKELFQDDIRRPTIILEPSILMPALYKGLAEYLETNRIQKLLLCGRW